MIPAKITSSEKKGRLVVATRAIKKGEIILRIGAIATALSDSELHRFCSKCFSPLMSIIEGSARYEKLKNKKHGSSYSTCNKCKKVSFCNKCAKTDQAIHVESGECDFINQHLANSSLWTSDTMFMRLLLRICHYSKNGVQSSNNPLETSSFEHYKLQDSVLDSWKAVLSLESKTNDEILITQCEKDAESAFKYCPVLEKNGHKKEDIITLLKIMYLNAHEVSFPKSLGCALHPTGALFNHSCKPNIAFYHDKDGNLVFRTTSEVSEGTELCSTYIDLYKPSQIRKELLQKRYNFLCDCERCTNPLDDQYLVGFVCQVPSCGNVSPNPSNENEMICSKCNAIYKKEDYVAAEEKVKQLHKEAIAEMPKQNFLGALNFAIKSFAAGTFLHPYHHLNYQTNELLAAIGWDLRRFEIAVKYLEKQIECIKGVFGDAYNSNFASKQRLLAIYLQDQANELAQSRKDAGPTIEKSKKAFRATYESFTFLIGTDHWYATILKRILDMFEGKGRDEGSVSVHYL